MMIRDRGVEWEVFDESSWSLTLAMELDYLPQTQNPGLLFVSRSARRRLWPSPAGWDHLSQPELVELLDRAQRVD
jgi:hypothetical protein